MPDSAHHEPASSTTASGCLTVLAVLGVAALAIGLVLLVTYGIDSHHDTRDSILWPGPGRDLIPPTATDITLRRDLLDHWASYTVSEADLNAFLDGRFEGPSGEPLDSYGERSPTDRAAFERAYAQLGWAWTEGMVTYHCTASNGGAHSYYHDPATGRTYQVSAYW